MRSTRSSMTNDERGVETGAMKDRTEVVYVSPLKALSVDIHKNLEVPLAGIAELAAARGIALPTSWILIETGYSRSTRQPTSCSAGTTLPNPPDQKSLREPLRWSGLFSRKLHRSI